MKTLLNQGSFWQSKRQICVTNWTQHKICMGKYITFMQNSRLRRFLWKWLNFARKICWNFTQFSISIEWFLSSIYNHFYVHRIHVVRHEVTFKPSIFNKLIKLSQIEIYKRKSFVHIFFVGKKVLLSKSVTTYEVTFQPSIFLSANFHDQLNLKWNLHEEIFHPRMKFSYGNIS